MLRNLQRIVPCDGLTSLNAKSPKPKSRWMLAAHVPSHSENRKEIRRCGAASTSRTIAINFIYDYAIQLPGKQHRLRLDVIYTLHIWFCPLSLFVGFPNVNLPHAWRRPLDIWDTHEQSFMGCTVTRHAHHTQNATSNGVLHRDQNHITKWIVVDCTTTTKAATRELPWMLMFRFCVDVRARLSKDIESIIEICRKEIVRIITHRSHPK